MLVERRFDAGTTVVAEGEPGRSTFIVHSGELVVSKLGDAGRVIRMTGSSPKGGQFRSLAGARTSSPLQTSPPGAAINIQSVLASTLSKCYDR